MSFIMHFQEDLIYGKNQSGAVRLYLFYLKLRRRNRRKDNTMKENYIKAFFTGIFALISSVLGVLAVPVLLMVACNVLDYATGLMASTYRSQDINSYKSIRGIMKKVCMWLLVIVGAVIDQLLLYASQTAGITLPFTFLVACIVAIWIICNEIISILENIKDMGVAIPAFLLPIVEHVKSQVEDKANIDKDSEGECSSSF